VNEEALAHWGGGGAVKPKEKEKNLGENYMIMICIISTEAFKPTNKR
jgi:hypothetical protein